MSVRNDKVGRLSNRRAGALMRQRFEPGGISPSDAVALRAHLASCEGCRSAYDRLALVRRLAAGQAADEPLASESRALLAEVLVRAGEPAVPARGGWLFGWRSWGAVAAAAAVAVVVLVSLPRTAVRQEMDPTTESRARGVDRPLPPVGLGLSGVDPEGLEYEVVESGRVCREDALRFYVTRREPAWGYFFLFGIDGSGAVHWYAPVPEEGVSYALPEALGRPEPMPWEVVLRHGHREGPLLVVALFSGEPLGLTAVEAALSGRGTALLEAPEGAAALAEALGGGVLAATRSTRIIQCGERP